MPSTVTEMSSPMRKVSASLRVSMSMRFLLCPVQNKAMSIAVALAVVRFPDDAGQSFVKNDHRSAIVAAQWCRAQMHMIGVHATDVLP
jgi:hypothetical protein